MANLTNVSVGLNSTAFFRTSPGDVRDNWTGSPDYNYSINDQGDDFLASSLTAKVLQVCWLVPSLVLILGLNAIFIIAVARSPSLQKPRFLLPVNLAILDILLALVCIPNSIQNIVSESATDSAFLCLTQCVVYHGTAVCTITTLLLMAWDRYQAICNPFHYEEADGIRWTWIRLVYLTVPCFSNPMIYGFRSEELWVAVGRLFRRRERTNSTTLVRRHRDINQDRTQHMQQVPQLEDASEESDAPTPQYATRLSRKPTEAKTLDNSTDSDDERENTKTVVVEAVIEKRVPSKPDRNEEDICVELPGYVSSPEP
ncbi:OR4E2 [Branchiostoma lanceolatum]|uniref:OR4E2 protein n=1 Tax=Branchiostoma lanceolatum TaxID=7740 RepID=A0A8J9ZGU4_BRALA|nr:OR4E2 [Branchiostoma lanceolatum]